MASGSREDHLGGRIWNFLLEETILLAISIISRTKQTSEKTKSFVNLEKLNLYQVLEVTDDVGTDELKVRISGHQFDIGEHVPMTSLSTSERTGRKLWSTTPIRTLTTWKRQINAFRESRKRSRYATTHRMRFAII